MLTVQQAEQLILELVQPLDPESDREIVPILEATGRILAAPVRSLLDFPHWHNSAMDGYAVRYEDVKNSDRHAPVSLKIVAEIPAGKISQISLQPGEAARIFTGAMLPAGADTIVTQEETARDGDRVLILSAPTSKAFVRHRGDFYESGQELLAPGTQIGAPELAILAAAQCQQISVYRQLRLAILSTGDELISINGALQLGQIVDSNQYALTAFAIASGAVPISLGIIQDDRELLKTAISQALAQADVVLSTGGVSVGDYDYVEEILAELGGEILVRSVAIKPGKPLTVASFTSENSRGKKIYFGLPGNPVSALVSCWRFVSLALQKFSGLSPAQIGLKLICAQILEPISGAGKRETYVWGNLILTDGIYQFRPAPGSQNSGNLINLANINALVIVPIGETIIPEGAIAQVLQIR